MRRLRRQQGRTRRLARFLDPPRLRTLDLQVDRRATWLAQVVVELARHEHHAAMAGPF